MRSCDMNAIGDAAKSMKRCFKYFVRFGRMEKTVTRWTSFKIVLSRNVKYIL